MAEHDATPTEVVGDDLATRLRTALDSRVEPVRLDEIELRTRPAPASRNGSAALRAVAPVDGGDEVEVAEPEPRSVTEPELVATSSALRRRRHWASLVAAAAIVAVLAGIAVVVVRDPAQDLETVAPPPGPDAPGFEEPAVGGIYDLAGGLLRGRTVISTASAGGRVYVGYSPLPDAADEGDGGGVLVADASDGSVLADHLLDDAGSPASMAAVGDGVWFLGSGRTANTLWRMSGDDAPVSVANLPGPMELASDGTTVWLRGSTHLQARDATTGDLIGDRDGAEWAGRHWIVATGGSAWAVDDRTDEVVRLDSDGPRAVVRSTTGGPVLILGSAGGSLFVEVGGLVERRDPTADARQGEDNGLTAFPANVTGADDDGDHVWVVGEGGVPDPYSAVDVLVLDGRTGESVHSTLPIVGWGPHVAVIDDRGAALCVGIVPADGEGAVGSECHQISSPFGPNGTVSDGWTTSDPTSGSTITTVETATDTTDLAAPATATTVPLVTTTTLPDGLTPTTTPTPHPLDPRGISVAGLDPIRLGMTPDELTRATGLATVAVEPRCGPNGREVIGLPDGVYVAFNGDDTVRAVMIRTAAFATAEGLTVDSTVSDLLAVHPDADAFDQMTATQYIVAAPDRSSAIYFNTEGEDIESIMVVQGAESFMDLC